MTKRARRLSKGLRKIGQQVRQPIAGLHLPRVALLRRERRRSEDVASDEVLPIYHAEREDQPLPRTLREPEPHDALVFVAMGPLAQTA
eukprot:scaffold1402_cov254-Pinguiococcus_pyrenoidosus.AAC.5